MAYCIGSNVATNGLVLSLDAANQKSYISGSNTWYDLSGNRNSGSLVNGPTFDSANNGAVVFDGTDDYVTISHNSSQNLTSQGTISVWINPAVLVQGSYAGLIAKCSGGGANEQAYLLSWRQIADAMFGFICDGNGNNNEIYASLPTVANVWYNIVFTWNGSKLRVYTNSVLTAEVDQTINSQILNTDITIGGYTYKGDGGGAEYFNGDISGVLLYNRGLTKSEVEQNYNAQKSRFGL